MWLEHELARTERDEALRKARRERLAAHVRKARRARRRAHGRSTTRPRKA